jgi:hypothetical protein
VRELIAIAMPFFFAYHGFMWGVDTNNSTAGTLGTAFGAFLIGLYFSSKLLGRNNSLTDFVDPPHAEYTEGSQPQPQPAPSPMDWSDTKWTDEPTYAAACPRCGGKASQTRGLNPRTACFQCGLFPEQSLGE